MLAVTIKSNLSSKAVGSTTASTTPARGGSGQHHGTGQDKKLLDKKCLDTEMYISHFLEGLHNEYKHLSKPMNNQHNYSFMVNLGFENLQCTLFEFAKTNLIINL